MTEIELASDETMGLIRLSGALADAMGAGLIVDGIILSLEDNLFNVKLLGVRE